MQVQQFRLLQLWSCIFHDHRITEWSGLESTLKIQTAALRASGSNLFADICWLFWLSLFTPKLASSVWLISMSRSLLFCPLPLWLPQVCTHTSLLLPLIMSHLSGCANCKCSCNWSVPHSPTSTEAKTRRLVCPAATNSWNYFLGSKEARKEDGLVLAGQARRGQFTDLHFISEVPVIPSSYKLSDRIKKREDK